MVCGVSVVLDRCGIFRALNTNVPATNKSEFMASILLMGNPDAIWDVAEKLGEGHDLYTWVPDVTFESLPGLVQLENLEDAPENLDAVFVLTLHDDGELESCLSLLLEFANPAHAPLFVNTLFLTATDVQSMVGELSPVVGISVVPGLTNIDTLVEAAPALQLSPEQADAAVASLSALLPGSVERVEDRIALITARVLAMIINEAAFAVMEGVASAEDIDTAMKLGTNYPKGPLAWADEIGADVVVGILQALTDEYGEERYRPCVLLKQYARAGKTFYPETVIA